MIARLKISRLDGVQFGEDHSVLGHEAPSNRCFDALGVSVLAALIFWDSVSPLSSMCYHSVVYRRQISDIPRINGLRPLRQREDENHRERKLRLDIEMTANLLNSAAFDAIRQHVVRYSCDPVGGE